MIFTTKSSRNFLGRWLTLGMLLVLPVFVTARVHAQTDTAQIQGTVADASGAVISGAKITVTNLGTAATYTATSDAAGDFSFNALQRGQYSA